MKWLDETLRKPWTGYTMIGYIVMSAVLERIL